MALVNNSGTVVETYDYTPFGTASATGTVSDWRYLFQGGRLDSQSGHYNFQHRDYDPATVPPDYQGYYARDQRLVSGPHSGEPTPEEVREEGTKFCVGTPEDCIRFLEIYEALGIEEVFLLCAIGPARHEEVMHTIRLFGEQVIPHFQAKTQRAAALGCSG